MSEEKQDNWPEVGETVAISGGYGGTTLATVKRLTKTQIIVVSDDSSRERRFRRESYNREVGATGWGASHLNRVDSESTIVNLIADRIGRLPHLMDTELRNVGAKVRGKDFNHTEYLDRLAHIIEAAREDIQQIEKLRKPKTQ